MHTIHTVPARRTLVKPFSCAQTTVMRSSITSKEISYPLSFRVPFSEVQEIDRAVIRERRKRRSDLLEAVWNVAWAEYERSGSLQAFATGWTSTKRTKRVSEELQDQLYTALGTILER